MFLKRVRSEGLAHISYFLESDGEAAVIDPRRKVAIDVSPSNNEWTAEKGPARRAATKWAARYLFWLQNLLELHAVAG